jgi:hypothetical protein
MTVAIMIDKVIMRRLRGRIMDRFRSALQRLEDVSRRFEFPGIQF